MPWSIKRCIEFLGNISKLFTSEEYHTLKLPTEKKKVVPVWKIIRSKAIHKYNM